MFVVSLSSGQEIHREGMRVFFFNDETFFDNVV